MDSSFDASINPLTAEAFLMWWGAGLYVSPVVWGVGDKTNDLVLVVGGGFIVNVNHLCVIRVKHVCWVIGGT